MSTMNMTQHLKSQGGSFSRSKTSRPTKPFPPCKHCGFNDHLSDDCVNYPICDICGSYDHDTLSYNRVISLRRGIKPRNPQHVIKSYETYGSTVHTKNDHNDIELVRRGEALHAKKAEAFQSHKTESSNANRSKTPTKMSSSALEMLVPGHAVGNVMGSGRANVDNIRKISEASVEISDNKSSCGDRVAVISGKPEQKRIAESLIQTFIMAT
ncbi:retrovirus-related pol polyprotein from transposon TNT 1-94 [Tanacetum coccineum]